MMVMTFDGYENDGEHGKGENKRNKGFCEEYNKKN
jgi:hypothetical protein